MAEVTQINRQAIRIGSLSVLAPEDVMVFCEAYSFTEVADALSISRDNAFSHTHTPNN